MAQDNAQIFTMPPARDHKLGKCYDFARVEVPVIEVDDSLKPTLSVFRDNASRQRQFFVLILFALNFCRDVERAEIFAEIEMYGQPNKNSAIAERPTQIRRRLPSFFHDQSLTDKAMGIGPENITALSFKLADMFERFRMVSVSPAQEIVGGIQSIFSSMLLSTWTAFEIMTEDLWVSALNKHPNTLANLSGSPTRISKQTHGNANYRVEDTRQPRDSKAILLNTLVEYQFDSKSSMGRLLKGRYSFDTLAGIRGAYSAAFSKRHGKIDAALSNKKIDGLSTLRNVIVHRGSIADDEYIKKSRNLGLPSFNLNDPIELDGDLVVPLVLEVEKCALDLIAAVNEWLATP